MYQQTALQQDVHHAPEKMNLGSDDFYLNLVVRP